MKSKPLTDIQTTEPLRIPQTGRKYKINWIGSKSDVVLLSRVKVVALYSNKLNGKIIEYRDHGIKSQMTLEEWNNRLAVESDA